jgi:lipoic acid synthetase
MPDPNIVPADSLAKPSPAPAPIRHPPWIKVRIGGGETYARVRGIIKRNRLHTVCEEAECPNAGECWGHGTATFLLMGDICTRACRFCAVKAGRPAPLDPEEPARIAAAIEALGLRYAVLTSVNRDELPDGGADHIARTVEAIRARLPDCGVEALVPDFRGDPAAVERMARSPLTVFAHNVETVPSLYRTVRPGSRYDRSLRVLEMAKELVPGLLTKSGLMLGLGEERKELEDVFSDLRDHGCDILTLGQYLRPSRNEAAVVRYLPPEEFAELREVALRFGFRHAVSGPLVRSSYHAWEAMEGIRP